MIKADKYFKKNLKDIIKSVYVDDNPRGKYSDGSSAYSRFITQVFEKYDLQNGEYPITTLRNTSIKTGISEILWIYQKQSNCLKEAKEMGVNWWDSWDIGDGTIGNRYGYTIKKYGLIDKLLYDLEKNPFSRRHIINLYQEKDLESSDGLFPCAYETLWSVREEKNIKYLDLTLIQRSNDYIISGYINKIQYVALLMMVASHLSYEIGIFSHFVQNLHIYNRHFTAAMEILDRKPLNTQPILELKEKKKFYEFTSKDFIIKNIKGIKKLNSFLDLAI